MQSQNSSKMLNVKLVTISINLAVFLRITSAELIGFWPFNCDYNGNDVSGYGLHFSYNRLLPTAPNFHCTEQRSIRGSLSMRNSGDALSLKYMEIGNPGPQHLDIGSGFTWMAYLKASQEEFTVTNAPIFSFEKANDVTQFDAGFGIIWWNSALVLVMSGASRFNRGVALTYGTGMSQDEWFKVALSADLVTGVINFKVSRVRDNLVTSQSTISNGDITNRRGLNPYLNGRIRLGAYVETNNNNNFRFYSGKLSCVKLYNHAMTLSDMNIGWGSIPDECSNDPSFTDPCLNDLVCSNDELEPEPGYVAGSCSANGMLASCSCTDGYQFDDENNICKDIDESLTNNCGCEDVCVNKYLDRDGIKFQCQCLEENFELDSDGVTCREILPFSALPLFGPEAGGTEIVISYDFLRGRTSFPRVDVRLAGNRLDYVQINDTHISVTTPQYGDRNSLTADVEQDFEVKVSGTSVSGNAKFTYKPNPVLEEVFPLRSIIAGGTLLTVTGSNMDSVAKPELLITGVSRSSISLNTGATSTTTCSLVDESRITCPMPAVNVNDQSRRRKRQTEDELAELYIGLKLDGVNNYRNLSESLPQSSRVTIFENPEFEEFDNVVKYYPEKRERLNIKGRSMDLGASINDYIIILEDTECVDKELITNKLSCLPPKKEPSMKREGAYEKGKTRVTVQVGNMDVYIGQMEYIEDNGVDENMAVLIGGCVGGGIACVLIIIIVACCCIKCRSGKKAKKYEEKKRRAGQDGRHFDNNLYNSKFGKGYIDRGDTAYDNVSQDTKRQSQSIDKSNFRLSDNMFIQNDRLEAKGRKGKNSKAKNKKSQKEEDYYSNLMSKMELPSIKNEKGADFPTLQTGNNIARKHNSYVKDPTANFVPVQPDTKPSSKPGYVNIPDTKPSSKPGYVNVNAMQASYSNNEFHGDYVNVNAPNSNLQRTIPTNSGEYDDMRAPTSRAKYYQKN